MYFLPSEVQLDILKCLNFKQLLNIQQTNRFYENFINKYEEELARKEFDKLEVISSFNYNIIKYKFLTPTPELYDFQLSEQLEEKWRWGIKKKIPMFLSTQHVKINIIVYKLKRAVYFQLPNFPKNIEEMKINHYWLEQIFKCAFKYVELTQYFIFNPQMIELLFDENKIKMPLQIYSQKSDLVISHQKIKSLSKFALNHLISNQFSVSSCNYYYAIYFLFKILTEGGNGFSTVCCWCIDLSKIYIRIIKKTY
uniref:F-box domain-containing protein n=1 Tax=Meloidogyne enterolobii TaxID=390850 RepID=A0A6V7UED4_MELEN|nr:unnamed protein product [Meloidogyne enterolobii]